MPLTTQDGPSHSGSPFSAPCSGFCPSKIININHVALIHSSRLTDTHSDAGGEKEAVDVGCPLSRAPLLRRNAENAEPRDYDACRISKLTVGHDANADGVGIE
jgi:hypothetical protein